MEEGDTAHPRVVILANQQAESQPPTRRTNADNLPAQMSSAAAGNMQLNQPEGGRAIQFWFGGANRRMGFRRGIEEGRSQCMATIVREEEWMSWVV